MICNTKTGVLISGSILRDPELKFVGQQNRPVLKFILRYGSEQGEDGKRRGKFIDVDVWAGAEDLQNMLREDDQVLVSAREVKSREYNGKTYYSVSADGVFPDTRAVSRWLDQVISCIPAPAAAPVMPDVTAPPAPASGAAAEDPYDITGHELYEGEQLSAYDIVNGKRVLQQPAPVPATQGAFALVSDNEDLPF